MPLPDRGIRALFDESQDERNCFCLATFQLLNKQSTYTYPQCTHLHSYSPRMAERMRDLYPAAKRVGLDAGHCPQDESPEAVNRELLQWIEEMA